MEPGYSAQPSVPTGGLIVISGESGVGKTHLIRQVLLDPEWGPDRVLIFYAENPMQTIGEDAGGRHFVRLRAIEQFSAEVEKLVALKSGGGAFPFTIAFMDSLTGLADYQFMKYEDNPTQFMVPNDRGDMVPNAYAKYYDFGSRAGRACIRARDELGIDFVMMATTYGRPPIYTLPGNVVPRNLNRWSSACLHMVSEKGEIPLSVVDEIVAGTRKAGDHQSLGRDEQGRPTGVVVSRFFETTNNGEVLAKGHRSLGLREKAVLPMILRKIHGKPESATRGQGGTK